MKKALVCVVAAFFLVGCNVKAGYNPDRYHYERENCSDVAEQPDKAKSASSFTIDDPLQYFALDADVIVTATILSNGTEEDYLFLEDWVDGPIYTRTFYDMRINDVWFGEAKEGESVNLAVFGGLDWGVSKPHKGDELILMLYYMENENCYRISGGELGIFAINPPTDTLYAFSPIDETVQFDGEDPNVLYKVIKEKLESATQTEKPASHHGKIGEAFVGRFEVPN